MIYDALTNPRGYKLTIQRWRTHPDMRQIQRARGYKIPAINFVALEATPARALLNHGVWRAWCPDCAFAAEDVWRGHNLFWCMRCGNAGCGNSWRPLIWPPNRDEIEAALDPFPSQAQIWEPWGEAVDYVAEAEAWVAKATAMVDPEHGLTDNEVGGADDPETYTVPIIAVTNAIIASSDANVDKGDIRYFRQFMSNNPGAANYLLQASGTDAGSWVAGPTAVAAALGYTPVNRAADLNLVGAHGWAANAYLDGGSNTLYLVTGQFVYIINVSNPGTPVGTIDVANGTFAWLGSFSPNSYGGGSTAAGTPSVLGLSAGTGGVSTTGQLASTVATGTAPLAVASTTKVANLNVDALDGFDWKQGKTAAFSGSTSLSTTPTDVSGVSISADRDGQWEVTIIAEFLMALGDGFPAVFINAGGSNVEEGRGPDNAANAFQVSVTDYVTVSGTTTIKAQVSKSSSGGASTVTYAKLMAKWIAP